MSYFVFLLELLFNLDLKLSWSYFKNRWCTTLEHTLHFFSYRQVHVYATVFNSYLLEASLLDGCSKESHWEMCGVLFTALLHAECSLRYIETTDLSKGHQHYKFKSNGIDLWDFSFSKFSVQCYIALSMIVN